MVVSEDKKFSVLASRTPVSASITQTPVRSSASAGTDQQTAAAPTSTIALSHDPAATFPVAFCTTVSPARAVAQTARISTALRAAVRGSRARRAIGMLTLQASAGGRARAGPAPPLRGERLAAPP